MKVIPKKREFFEEKHNDDFYSRSIINEELDDDNISTYEQAFMSGYLKA